jgi:N-dimethylarginine dimethylaminohydrolase
MPHAHHRTYLLCPPTEFTVSYEINPWMDASRPVDTALAVSQWERLRDALRDVGHTVEVIDPLPGLPDMVYAANGATVQDGVAYAARFRYPQRRPEAAAYLKWLADHGFVTREAARTNEGEGDLLRAGDVLLAGYGPRTEVAAHAEAAQLWDREVVSLELVDPRFYHLDTALTVLSGSDGSEPDVAYYPPAFSPAARDALHERFPDALLARDEDATVLGLNAVCDGLHVVHAPGAVRFAAELAERGYEPVGVDTSELLRGGGGAKCCVLELRRAVDLRPGSGLEPVEES